jgi:hypothetical protein
LPRHCGLRLRVFGHVPEAAEQPEEARQILGIRKQPGEPAI